MICSVAFWRMARCEAAVGINVLHWLGPLIEPSLRRMLERWLRATLLLRPCDKFFRASVTPAERWSLRTGIVMNLLTMRLTRSDR